MRSLLLMGVTLTLLLGCSVGPQIDPVLGQGEAVRAELIELHSMGASTQILGLAGAATTADTVVAENLTAPSEGVAVTPDEDGGFSVLVPGQVEDVYRLTPSTMGIAGRPIEVTADADGGAAIDLTTADATDGDAGTSDGM
ncbi:MAG: hypothetical protein JRH11_27320 [Deltaproteobacteria bacterium]|nr:hypothetical protein [Deltaproteobacteria bacterium]